MPCVFTLASALLSTCISVWPGILLQSAILHPHLSLQDETEYETDSEDEGYGQQLLKPMFVSKSEREVCAVIFSMLLACYLLPVVKDPISAVLEHMNASSNLSYLQTIAERERLYKEAEEEKEREKERKEIRAVSLPP